MTNKFRGTREFTEIYTHITFCEGNNLQQFNLFGHFPGKSLQEHWPNRSVSFLIPQKLMFEINDPQN